ncbi:hypothetical protein GCM10023231_05020 [Olivibacter ginsenosidimutans]|uniref:Uncharacterized protein n=1 Tax=Olivibacter ginsenosidimutans TaxID=1176537 RepID=A0ABP9AIF4_9SPHI
MKHDKMDKFYNETLSKLETSITETGIDADCSVQRIEAVIHLIVECLSEIKKYVFAIASFWGAVVRVKVMP